MQPLPISLSMEIQVFHDDRVRRVLQGDFYDKPYKAGTIDDKIREVNKPKLLILDELGFIPFTPLQGQLLFELISARYEKKSIIVTSNKMPGEWGTVFGDAAAATASLDRLLHHCTPMLISGESYRTREFARKMRE